MPLPILDKQEDWLEMTMGAWSYQLPSEPSQPYPIPVWYRVPFHALAVPKALSLIVDGFAGAAWKLYINGQPVEETPVRSAIDSQMKAVDIAHYVCQGENMIALRLEVTGPTDGLLDFIKLVGDFRVEPGPDGKPALAAPGSAIQPADWTTQGYPFYSGTGCYRTQFSLPENISGKRVFLRANLYDDSLEVLVNGQSAGVRLWPPYDLEITGHAPARREHPRAAYRKHAGQPVGGRPAAFRAFRRTGTGDLQCLLFSPFLKEGRRRTRWKIPSRTR